MSEERSCCNMYINYKRCTKKSLLFMFTTMNVDKFGHHVHKRQRFGEIIRIECALKRTDDNNLSIENRRLQNLSSPQELNDAATKEYTDKAISDFWVNHIKKKYLLDLFFQLDKLENKINSRLDLIENKNLKQDEQGTGGKRNS